MQIETTRFGLVEVPEEALIYFKGGIIGFPRESKFALIPHGDSTLIAWLQSAVTPSLAFPVVSAHGLVVDYPDVPIVPVAEKAGLSGDADDFAVLDASGTPLSVPLDAKVSSFGDDGMLSVDGSDVGQLKLVKFRDLDGLEKDGDTLFRATERSGFAEVAPVTVLSGTLEMPNVSIVKGMTDLVSATRAFEALQKAVEAFSALERRAANDIVGAR